MFAGTAGYGVTESMGPVEGTHHRLRGVVGAGVAVTDWLALGLNLDGRYDIHPKDKMGADATLVGDPRILARAGYRLSESLQMGGEIGVWFPGDTPPSFVAGATTFDGILLAAYSPQTNPLTIATLAGVRFDNSARSVDEPSRLRTGDRIAIGVSEFNTCLLGLGATYRIQKTELIGEITWDILLGEGAPAATTSPLRVDTGVRYHALRSLQLELLTEISLSKRPQISSSDALIPLEPRFNVLAGLRYILNTSGGDKPKRTASVAPKEKVKRLLPNVNGQILDQDGQPVEGAQVQMVIGKTIAETTTDSSGIYSFNAVPIGNASLKLHTNGFEEFQWDVLVTPDFPTQKPLRLKPVVVETKLPVGQLRGLVRSFSGTALQAKVYVEPVGIEVSTDDAGRFQIDVPPGSYRVSLQANGYRLQKLQVKVKENGVSIINVELREVR